MFKIISILFLLLSLIDATEVSLTTQNIRSYPLPKDKIGIKLGYTLINSGIDIFSIRDSSSGKAIKHGSLGNLNGIDLSLGYGYSEFISFVYNLEYQNIDYASTSLKNSRNELIAKVNIYHNPSAFINTFTTDFGFIHNSADDLSITGSSLAISKMSDLSDSSFYMRLLAGTKIMSSVLDFYLGLNHTSIDTKIDGISYDRTEVALDAGFQYTVELGSFLIESGYKYIRLFNRDVNNVQKSNHVINLTLSKVINRDFLIFIGSKYYIHQYNGVIPYLYNNKTKNEFNQKFGFATVGFVYNFNTGNIHIPTLNSIF